MFIEKIKIKNFRNIKNEIFVPSKNINIIYGENANGKTSYIESIYLVSNLKSFRTQNVNETINIGNNLSEIDCEYINNNCKENISLHITKNNKKYNKNKKNCKIDEYLSSVFSIVFKPDDIILVNGSPSKRRDLIDKAIFFIDSEYIKTLKKYYKVIANKNLNLKNNKIGEIEEWNFLVAKYSSIIFRKRSEYILRINSFLDSKNNYFSSNYKIISSLNDKDIDIEEYFLEELKKNKKREIKYKYSLVGAHRENIDFLIDNQNLKIFGSQGQKRAFILLFRSSQIEDFETINNFSPVLLLDDMASELDEKNKNIFFNILNNFSGQTFITTTDKNIFTNSDKTRRFHVDNGTIGSFS